MPLTFIPRQRTTEDKKVIFSQPVSLPLLSLGNFTLQTNEVGALEAKPVSSPDQAPAVSVSQPVSLVTDLSGIFIQSTAEFGGRVLLLDLLNKLVDIPISIGNVEMPIRSLFGALFARVAATEANVADISGVRLAAEEAKSAAQVARDALQDVSGALLQLEVATRASDLSGVLVRVAALEAAPGFDATALEGRVTNVESALGGKADLTYVDGELAGKAAAATVTTLEGRVDAAEFNIGAASSRIDALESAVPSKVAQADYDVFVAATNAALDGKAAVADLAAKADSSALAAKEDKGLMSALVVEDVVTAGFSGAYWGETIGAALAGHMDAGKIANYIFDAPAGEITIPAGSPVAGAVRRLRNGHATAVLPISLGGVSYEIVAGETAVFQYSGSAWRLL